MAPAKRLFGRTVLKLTAASTVAPGKMEKGKRL